MFAAFLLLAAWVPIWNSTDTSLAVTLYFVIPRAVSFQFWEGEGGAFALKGTPYFSRIPANFTFDAELHLMGKSQRTWR